MGLFSFLGIGSSRLKKALKEGAVVIDVRTASEFDRGKVPSSINIPIDRIPVNIERIRAMNRAVIFVCSSGARSANAIRILRSKGINNVYNGGNWEDLAKIARNA